MPAVRRNTSSGSQETVGREITPASDRIGRLSRGTSGSTLATDSARRAGGTSMTWPSGAMSRGPGTESGWVPGRQATSG